MEQIKRWVGNEKVRRAVLAFAGTYGVCVLGTHAGIPRASFSVMSIPVFLALFFLLSRTRQTLDGIAGKKQRGRRIRYAGIVSYLFSITMIAGYQLQNGGMTGGGFRGKAMLLLGAACLSVAVFPFWNFVFAGMEKAGGRAAMPENQGKKWGKLYGISFLAVFLCLIPVWLAYYPIVMSYDFHRQINEAVQGFAHFWPYQPLAHTWIIWVFLQLGYLLGDIQTGMACMALFQMLVYSLVAAYANVFLFRVTGKKWTAVTGVLFFGLFPLNSVMVVCTTKDVIFSVLFLLFVLLMAERFFFSQGKKQLVLDILLVVTGCLMVQFRNNCLYAVVVFGLFWLVFAPKKEKLRVLLLCVLLTAGGKGTAVLIKTAIGTKMEPAKVEMYSVPIMQMARVGYYYGETLDEETWELLNSYIPQECWADYHPAISDAVKGIVGVTTFPETWEDNTVQLVRDWFRLGIRYPNEYIDAFLELTRGYWFLDDRSYAECLGYGTEGRMGTIYTYNSAAIASGGDILHESKFPWLEERLEEIVSGNSYYDWPIVSVLFKSAFYFWSLFLVFAAFLFLGRKKQAVFILFPVIYMATMLLGPVVQLRYIFPVMIILPVLVSLLVLPGEYGAAERPVKQREE